MTAENNKSTILLSRRKYIRALDSSMKDSNDFGARQYFKKADFFNAELLLK